MARNNVQREIEREGFWLLVRPKFGVELILYIPGEINIAFVGGHKPHAKSQSEKLVRNLWETLDGTIKVCLLVIYCVTCGDDGTVLRARGQILSY